MSIPYYVLQSLCWTVVLGQWERNLASYCISVKHKTVAQGRHFVLGRSKHFVAMICEIEKLNLRTMDKKNLERIKWTEIRYIELAFLIEFCTICTKDDDEVILLRCGDLIFHDATASVAVDFNNCWYGRRDMDL